MDHILPYFCSAITYLRRRLIADNLKLFFLKLKVHITTRTSTKNFCIWTQRDFSPNNFFSEASRKQRSCDVDERTMTQIREILTLDTNS